MLELGYSDELLLPVNVQTVSDYFRRACRINGIEDLRFHDLRHEAATRYAEDGFTIPQLQTITLHTSWNSLKRYVNLRKRGLRLDYPSAIEFAQQQYDGNYSKFASKQRYVSATDIADTEEAYAQVEAPDSIKAEFSFVEVQLLEFVKKFRPTKSIVNSYKDKSNIKNIFAWNEIQQCFVVPYIQNAWEIWFKDNSSISWDQLLHDATHFSITGLDVFKLDNNRVHKWESKAELWFDITKYFDLNSAKLISK